MTSPTAIHDRVLHLSLADWRTALKRRVKGPKRPSWWTVFWACYCAWCAFGVVLGVFEASAAGIIGNGAYLAGGWHCLIHKRRSMPWLVFGACTAVAVPCLILDALGVIS